jgi:hypothetical protein
VRLFSFWLLLLVVVAGISVGCARTPYVAGSDAPASALRLAWLQGGEDAFRAAAPWAPDSATSDADDSGNPGVTEEQEEDADGADGEVTRGGRVLGIIPPLDRRAPFASDTRSRARPGYARGREHPPRA